MEEGASGREKEGALGPIGEVGKAVVRDKGTGWQAFFHSHSTNRKLAEVTEPL